MTKAINAVWKRLMVMTAAAVIIIGGLFVAPAATGVETEAWGPMFCFWDKPLTGHTTYMWDYQAESMAWCGFSE